MDDHPPLSADDPLGALQRQDLDPLSADELEARIVALEAEIARTRRRLEFAFRHRADADALFRR